MNKIHVRLKLTREDGDIYDYLKSFSSMPKAVNSCLYLSHHLEEHGITREMGRREKNSLEYDYSCAVPFSEKDRVLYPYLRQKKEEGHTLSQFVKSSILLKLYGVSAGRQEVFEFDEIEEKPIEKKKVKFDTSSFGVMR
jgi:hypothetical protein